MASVIVAGDVSGTCTLQAPSAAGSTVLTLPVIATDTLAGIAATQTLTNKTLVAPALGTPASGVLTNCTGVSVASVSGTLAVANGGTGVTAASTGTGGVVLSASPTFTGTPLSTTAASATNTTQIATTAFAYGTLSNATSGYTKLANGLILQWGTTGSIGVGATSTITLPIAFPTTFYNVVITRNTSSLAASYTASVVKGTLANFIVYNNGITSAQTWTAVGI